MIWNNRARHLPSSPVVGGGRSALRSGRSPQMQKNTLNFALVAVTLVLLGYVVAYFATVREGDKVGHGPGCIHVYPMYRGGLDLAQLFQPMHYLDRHYLRHSEWIRTPEGVNRHD
jgi:hypothetical protein